LIYKSVGGEFKHVYFTTGLYDNTSIIEAPNDEALLKTLFIIGRSGKVKTETFTAIPAENRTEIIKGVPVSFMALCNVALTYVIDISRRT
jgi:uncharacterized protein with GYD domain